MKVVIDGEMGKSQVCTVKITKALLDALRISEEDAWTMAFENSQRSASIRPLCSVLSQITGGTFNDDVGIFVAICNDGYDGAAALAMPELFRAFCENKGFSSVYIIPSSTQELIVLPQDDAFDVSSLLSMEREITFSEVEPRIQMPVALYLYDSDTNRIITLQTLDQEDDLTKPSVCIISSSSQLAD